MLAARAHQVVTKVRRLPGRLLADGRHPQKGDGAFATAWEPASHC
jgi:hypothetical protein